MADIAWIWLETFTRWLHVLAGVVWIGNSFYFVALDQSLKPREGLPTGAHGEAWQVHGGGFYHMVKYLVAPNTMPDELRWFKWESYTTWASGFFLLVLVYYFGAELYLIDEQVMALSQTAAIAVSFVGLLIGWVIYDQICRSPIGRDARLLALTGFVFLVAATYGFAQILSARGAFMQMGALIGTIMVANVAHVIIPGQRKVVKALLAGEKPDPEHGRVAKQRSVHNNYLTLPVVFIMIGGHYPLAFATPYAWAIIALLLIIGVLIRHFYNTSHQGLPPPWWTWGATAACAIGIVLVSSLGPNWTEIAREEETDLSGLPAPTLASVHEIVETRCAMCHAAEPLWDGLLYPPKGVILESPEDVRAHALNIMQQAVWSNAMPPGNITYMEPQERLLLAAWRDNWREHERNAAE
ncbi:MAG: urate hydroxylase PuuD [Rhodobacteraceae bacterium]|nr:urate hydroxylase PuuD [Paracoccaceae bacterium]